MYFFRYTRAFIRNYLAWRYHGHTHTVSYNAARVFSPVDAMKSYKK